MNTKRLAEIRTPAPGPGINGLVQAALAYGIMVAYESDSTPENQRKLVLANGQPGFFLDTRTLSRADWDAYILGKDMQFTNELRTPIPVGENATARDWVAVEVEGTDYVDTTNLTGSTDAKTPLKLVNGKWTPCTANGDIISGILERKLSPVVAANTTRFFIRNFQGVFAETA
jgi:hypothetical protein